MTLSADDIPASYGAGSESGGVARAVGGNPASDSGPEWSSDQLLDKLAQLARFGLTAEQPLFRATKRAN